jgi:hypothetical protein
LAQRRLGVQILPKTYYGSFLFPDEQQEKKGGFSGILP